MKVISNGIHNGYFDDCYGKFGTQFKNDMPTFSIPFTIQNAPKETQSFVVVLDDADAIPVAGFVWIHWLVANLTQPNVPENISVSDSVDFVQGQNSWGENLYGGMAPPNCTHTYDLKVYALDTVLPLENGFTYNELMSSMEGHVLSETTLSGKYRHQK